MCPQPQQNGDGDIPCGAEIVRGQSQERFEQAEHIRKKDAGVKYSATVSGGAFVSYAMRLNAMVEKYRKLSAYAADIEYGQIMAVLRTLAA